MADAAATVAHLVCADDMLLVGTSLGEAEDMCMMLHGAAAAKSRKVWEEKLELWSSTPPLPPAPPPRRCGRTKIPVTPEHGVPWRPDNPGQRWRCTRQGV